MISGALTEVDESIRRKLKEQCYGMSICGAGGGGFMMAILKKPVTDEAIASLRWMLQVEITEHQCTLHKIAVENEGMRVSYF